mgnify:FL=1
MGYSTSISGYKSLERTHSTAPGSLIVLTRVNAGELVAVLQSCPLCFNGQVTLSLSSLSFIRFGENLLNPSKYQQTCTHDVFETHKFLILVSDYLIYVLGALTTAIIIALRC